MTADRRASTAQVLDEMVAGIMGVKANKAAQLTPVGTETASISPLIPNDVPGVIFAKEGLRDIAADLRKQAQFLLDVAQGLEALVGTPEASKADAAKLAEIDRKLAEKEADRRVADRAAAEAGDKRAAKRVAETEAFDQRYERLQSEAQAAVFVAAERDDDPPADGWVCPTHGNEDIRNLTSPKGRKYRQCGVPNCKEFER